VPTVRVKASAEIPAPAAVIYALIADYRNGHPRIVPPAYFENLVVEEGGVGAGTRIRYTVKAMGAKQHARATITEPEPGRVLVETVDGGHTATTFTVEPGTGAKTRVTIATEHRATGLRGWVEALVTPGFLRKVYAAELQLIAQRALEASQGAQKR
jgi:Polyketide cyclase / dehydrase and lipid transport